jgi:hypothetical protein
LADRFFPGCHGLFQKIALFDPRFRRFPGQQNPGVGAKFRGLQRPPRQGNPLAPGSCLPGLIYQLLRRKERISRPIVIVIIPEIMDRKPPRHVPHQFLQGRQPCHRGLPRQGRVADGVQHGITGFRAVGGRGFLAVFAAVFAYGHRGYPAFGSQVDIVTENLEIRLVFS